MIYDDHETAVRMTRAELNRIDQGARDAFYFGRGLLLGWGSGAFVAALTAYAFLR